MSSIAPVASSSRIDRGSADRLLFAKHEAPLRSSPSANVAFQQFVDAHRHLLVDWMARRMTFELVGPQANQVEPDDVLSRAMERLWLRFEHMPSDPDQRKAWVERALRLGALDAIRFQFGRHKLKPSARCAPTPGPREQVAFVRVISVDFAPAPNLREREGLAAEAGQAIQRLAAATGNRYDDVLTRAAVVGAIATLTSAEQRVLRLTLEGRGPQEIVEITGMRPEVVRELLTTARWLVRRFVDHADADRLPERHRNDLHRLLDGSLRGRARTRAHRHLRACAACQRAADLYRLGDRQLAAVLVLPGLIDAGAYLPGGAAGGVAAHAASTSNGAAGSLGSGLKGGGLMAKLGTILPGGKLAVLSSAAVIGTGSAVAGVLAAGQPQTRPAPGQAAPSAAARAQSVGSLHLATAGVSPQAARVSQPQHTRAPRSVIRARHSARRATTVAKHSPPATSAAATARRSYTSPAARASYAAAQSTPTSSGANAPAGGASSATTPSRAASGGGLTFGHP